MKDKTYVYVWADGIYLQARMEDDKQCLLVIIGATPEGKKELLGFPAAAPAGWVDYWQHSRKPALFGDQHTEPWSGGSMPILI